MVELPAKPVEIPKNLARFIYITGCDGTGKTTQVSLLLEKLQAAGVKTCHVWLRFPFFFSLPLLAYARWRGFSWYEHSGGIKHGYWDFSRSRLLQNILPWLLLLDASLAGFAKIYLPIWRGETVICERFVLDMLVDLSLAFGGKDLYKKLPGRLYLKLLPRNAKIFILNLDAATIRNRRADLRTDNRLEERLKAYQLLSNDLSLQLYSSTVHFHTLNQLIVNAAIS
jgi:thymidylate kinase